MCPEQLVALLLQKGELAGGLRPIATGILPQLGGLLLEERPDGVGILVIDALELSLVLDLGHFKESPFEIPTSQPTE